MINFKEIALNTITGLYWIGILVAVIVGYGYLISLFNLSQIVENVILFAPLVLFAAYNMGALRRLNSKK